MQTNTRTCLIETNCRTNKDFFLTKLHAPAAKKSYFISHKITINSKSFSDGDFIEVFVELSYVPINKSQNTSFFFLLKEKSKLKHRGKTYFLLNGATFLRKMQLWVEQQRWGLIAPIWKKNQNTQTKKTCQIFSANTKQLFLLLTLILSLCWQLDAWLFPPQHLWTWTLLVTWLVWIGPVAQGDFKLVFQSCYHD